MITIRVAGLIKDSLVDGYGMRDVIFLQGCEHHCDGCHNPDTWDRKGGVEFSIPQLMKVLEHSENDITISGGEPLLQFQDDLWHFMKDINLKQGKRFWLYTGFKYENIPIFMLIMLSEFVDVMIDGKFEKDKVDSNLRFRGSSNQRLIDLPKSVHSNEIVLWDGGK